MAINSKHIFRIFKDVVSSYVRKDGTRLVKHYGCNGTEHRIAYTRLDCDSRMTYVNGGNIGFRDDKVLGPCDHVSCKNHGGFVASEVINQLKEAK